MNTNTKCRRCSECRDSEHHWMECCEIIDEGLETGELIFDRVCKHCELLGTACEECSGAGWIATPAYVAGGEIVGADGETCLKCNGEGAFASCFYSEDDDDE